ncbi:PA26 p53-induced protein-domain-containing protein [Chlamydoabsidia padenii]|nr:PA26 p53-induced protein-domain-containing protein [Chlamydoabsidia padenii]
MSQDPCHQNYDPHLEEETARDVRARRLESSRLRIALFKALQVDSFTERQVPLEKIIQVVKSYMRTAKSPFSPMKKTATMSRSSSTATPPQQQRDDEKAANTSLTIDTSESTNPAITNAYTHSIPQTNDDITVPVTCLETGGSDEELQYFLLTMLRLSYTCPFRDVRLTFQQFLKTTLDTGIIPTPQPRQLSPSYFIPLQDIFSLESTSSVQIVISYPRPSNLSYSPWSHDASDCGNGSDTISMEMDKSTTSPSMHNYIQHHRNHNRRSRSRLTSMASSFSSTTSSFMKSDGDPENDNDIYNAENDNDNDDDESLTDDGTSKPMSFTTRGKCTGGRPSDEYVRQMLVKTFLDEGRLSNVYRIISFFPTYYEIFQLTINNITKASIGPLHRTWRIYLGIMASAELQCQYLVSTLKLDFLQNGGDPTWLKGIDHCPVKLQRVTGFLTKMARQPWRLTEDDILALMMVPDSATRTNSTCTLNMTWSKGELVQAILVISTFLSLGSFVLSCGVAPELDMYGGYYVHGFDSCCGIENELDDNIQPTSHRHHHHRHQHLSMDEELAVRAASCATGWYDSQISPKSSKSSDTDDYEISNNDDEQQSFVSDKGAGLGVSMFDSDDENNISTINDEKHNSLYLDHTAALISKLKSVKGELKDELHQSLADLKIFSQNENNVAQQQQENDTLATDNELTEQQQDTGKVNVIYEDLSRFTTTTTTTTKNNDMNGSTAPLEYEAFEFGHEDYGEFMLSEYCWEDHGCDLVNHFLPGVGNELDDEFIESLSITDWSIFHQVTDGTVDTSPLRRAIFYYVQQLLGVTKEDYNYEDIPKYLGEQTRCYIQKVCHQPHLLDRNDWSNVGISLRSEEKCHMNLLIASARKQALLCYGLYFVSLV